MSPIGPGSDGEGGLARHSRQHLQLFQINKKGTVKEVKMTFLFFIFQNFGKVHTNGK